MTIPPYILGAQKLYALRNEAPVPASEIQDIVNTFPTIEEFTAFFNSLIIKTNDEESAKASWETSGLHSLLGYVMTVSKSKLKDDAKAVMEEHHARVYDNRKAIEQFFSLGYGAFDTDRQRAFYHTLLDSPYFPAWINKFGTANLQDILSTSTMCATNLKFLIEMDKKVPFSEPIRRSLADHTAGVMRILLNSLREDTALYTEDFKVIEDPHKFTTAVITDALTHLKAAGIIQPNKENFEILAASFFHPTWTKITLGDTKNINISTEDMSRQKNLQDMFISRALLSPKAWAKEPEYFKMLSYQAGFEDNDHSRVIGKARNRILVGILLDHPQVKDKITHISTSNVFFKQEPTKEVVMEWAKFICDRNVDGDLWDVARFAELGVDKQTFMQLCKKIEGFDSQPTPVRDIHTTLAKQLVQCGRFDLVETLNQEIIDWYKLGEIMPESAITIADGNASLVPDWKMLGQDEKLIGGYLATALSSTAKNPDIMTVPEIVEKVEKLRPLINLTNINTTALSTDFLINSAKNLGIHTALTQAKTLKVSPAVLTHPRRADGLVRQEKANDSLEYYVGTSGKIGHLQTLIKLGGAISEEGIKAAIIHSRGALVDYMLANSSMPVSAEVPKLHINHILKQDSESNTVSDNTKKTNWTNFTQIMQRCDTDRPTKLISELLEHTHVDEAKLQQLFGSLIAKYPAQQLYNQAIEDIEKGKLKREAFPLLYGCVTAGADPTKAIWLKENYNPLGKIQGITKYLEGKGELLIERFNQQSHIDQLTTTDETHEIGIF